jgi:hypothetical protein
MAMNRDVISALNDLIETSEDGVKVFRTCADAVTNREAKTFFADRVRLIEQGEAELKAEVRRLDQCARAEDAAVENYEAALRKDLPPEVRAIVERHYRGVLENRERVRVLKDRSAAARPGVAREAGREAPPPV